MTIDLEQSLAKLAQSVHDDGAAERMSGQVRTMVGRIRRRRAARYTANGVVGVAAAGAVVVGGAQLAGLQGPVAPPAASSSPFEPGPVRLMCGEPAPTAAEISDPTAATWQLDGQAVLDEGLGVVNVSTRLVDGDGDLVTWDAARPVASTVMALQDGLVVAQSTTAYAQDESFNPGDYVITDHLVDGASCGGTGPLPAGDYEFVVVQTVLVGEESTPVEMLGGPWPATVPEGVLADPQADAESDRELVEARATLAALLAAEPSGTFPSCGASVETMDDGAPPLMLADVPLGERVYAPGEDLALYASLRTTEGRSVIGNAGTNGAHLVLTQRGRVVGTVYRDTEDVDLVGLGPDDALTVPLTGRLQLCEVPMTDGPQLLLPPGAYQAYAVMEVMLKEITEADGEAFSRSDLTLATSPPIDITVEAPGAG